MDQPSTQIRTEVVKQIISTETPFDTIKACRDLTNNELEFIRVHMEITTPTKRPYVRKGKPDTRSIVGVARGDSAA